MASTSTISYRPISVKRAESGIIKKKRRRCILVTVFLHSGGVPGFYSITCTRRYFPGKSPAFLYQLGAFAGASVSLERSDEALLHTRCNESSFA